MDRDAVNKLCFWPAACGLAPSQRLHTLTFDKGEYPGTGPLYQYVYQSARLLFQAMTDALNPGTPSPFEQIRRVNDAGNPHRTGAQGDIPDQLIPRAKRALLPVLFA